MIKKLAVIQLLLLLPTALSGQNIDSGLYGERLCDNSELYCIEVQSYDSWSSLFPDMQNRLFVQKLNRLNIALDSGFTIAIPKDIESRSLTNFAPFLEHRPDITEKTLIWDPKVLAWAAYDKHGKLVRWGPGVGGKDYCYDTGEPCRTLVGDFRITRKQGPNYVSTIFNTNIPWYMAFHWRGFGFHGYDIIPGHNASHGCIRLFMDDAKWLNKQFVEVGTKVIIEPY